MKIQFLFAFVCAVLAFSGIAKGESEAIKIGVIAPLSGEVAPWGQDVRNALEFGAEKFGKNRFEFIFEDDQCLGGKAVSAAQKLIAVDKVDFGMVVCTESMLVTAPLFERAKVPVIAPVASGKNVTKAGDYIFRTWPSDAAASEVLYHYIAPRHKVIGLLTEERGYARELSDAFISASAGGPVRVKAEFFQSNMTDFRPLLLRLKKRGIDGLLINPNSENTFANVLKQQNELGISVPIYGAYIPGNEGFQKLAGGLSEGVIFVDSPSAENSLTPESVPLYKEFLARFGAPKSSSFIFASTYEALGLISMASDSKQDIRAFLYHGKFSGVFGSYSFDENGDIVGVKHVLMIITGQHKQVVPQFKK